MISAIAVYQGRSPNAQSDYLEVLLFISISEDDRVLTGITSNLYHYFGGDFFSDCPEYTAHFLVDFLSDPSFLRRKSRDRMISKFWITFSG